MRKVELRMNEEFKYKIIKKLIETNGNKKRVAVMLNKSVRQVDRMIAGYKEKGKEFFVHGNRGRKPAHALSEEEKTEVEQIYLSKYFDCTYTSFTEYLAKNENIFLSVDEVRTILRDRYIFSPRTHKSTRKRFKQQLIKEQQQIKNKTEKANIQAKIVAVEDAHPRQPRCQYFGEELQMDACIHLWFGKTKTALHATIDDATGQVVGLYFDKGTKCIVIKSFDGRLYATVDNSVFALEKISEVQAKSENFDEIEEIKERKVYIPRMTHPWKSKSFEDFVKTQKHRLENVA